MDASTPAGWVRDPFDRFQYRYWDGEQWTAHVSTDGKSEVDPLGVAESQPGVAPSMPGVSPARPVVRFGAMTWPTVVRVLVFGGAAGLVIGALLPWVKATAGIFSVTKNGIDGDGVLTLVLAVGIALLFGLLRPTQGAAVTTIVLGGLAAVIAGVDIGDVTQKARDLVNQGSGVQATVGVGLWITAVAAVVVIVGGVLALVDARRRARSAPVGAPPA
jgi:hypothetical protein